jgi:5-oxopent-3-ene-1,2,5-tricarboxylate decarboxylase / 2-hydroxyhepta-2,4-diene-1,7-dioate isomerase
MKTARFLEDGRVHTGVLEDGSLYDEAGRAHDPGEVTHLLPFEPGKVIGLVLSYRGHAGELGLDQPEEPVTFIKPNSSLVPHGAHVVYPRGAEYMHYECELAVVIGRGARNVSARDAMDCVLGYTIANDVTVRDFVGNLFRPPMKAKGWDTFGPMGPYLVSKDEIEDPHDLELRTYVNGELRQKGSTKDLIFSIPETIEFLTRFMTLHPYDVIITGTPEGLSHVHPGDVMRLEIDGLGALENPIKEEK